jgi:hypothetical protein
MRVLIASTTTFFEIPLGTRSHFITMNKVRFSCALMSYDTLIDSLVDKLIHANMTLSMMLSFEFMEYVMIF